MADIIITIKKADSKELMPLNCGAGKDSWKSLGQTKIALKGEGGAQNYRLWKAGMAMHWRVGRCSITPKK